MTIDRPPAVDSWLAASPTVERLELGGGSWVDVARGLVPAADAVHDEIIEGVSWQQGRVFRYERWIDEPRLGAVVRAEQRHLALAAVETWITRRYRVAFDSVALARYRDQRDSVAWHRDRELKWLDDTIIGVLTLGARRPWLMKPLSARRDDDGVFDLGVFDLAPASGDLIVMGGRCQTGWLHAVPKTPTPCRSRISAQWRWTSRRGRPDTAPSYFAPRRFSR